jgi:hypothetical protein
MGQLAKSGQLSAISFQQSAAGADYLLKADG